MKHSSPTYEWAESRRLNGLIITEARERLVFQHKFNRVKVYSYYYHKEIEEDRFDYKHLDNLIELTYLKLRGLYGIPFTFDEFSNNIYWHPTIRRWRFNREVAENNARIFNGRHKRHVRPWDISTSGESGFIQNGYTKKEVDQKEQSRRDWRERKGFTRDHRKDTAWCNCGRHLKALGNRLDRRHTKRLIRKQRYDDIYFHQDMWVSSWDAC